MQIHADADPSTSTLLSAFSDMNIFYFFIFYLVTSGAESRSRICLQNWKERTWLQNTPVGESLAGIHG